MREKREQETGVMRDEGLDVSTKAYPRADSREKRDDG